MSDKIALRKRNGGFMSKRKQKNFKELLSDDEKLKEAVLSEYCRIAFDDIGRYLDFEKDGSGEITVKCKDGENFPTDGIEEIVKNKNGFKFKLYSKERALLRLGMYLGLWKTKPEEADAEDISAIESLIFKEEEK